MIQLTFFEQELRRIVGPQYPEATYVGRACYVRLDEIKRAKIQFTTCGIADHYEALQLSILNRNDGEVDTLRLRFADIWGKGQYVWTDRGGTEWYARQPSSGDYRQLTEAVGNYLDVFQEQAQTQTDGQLWQQTM